MINVINNYQPVFQLSFLKGYQYTYVNNICLKFPLADRVSDDVVIWHPPCPVFTGVGRGRAASGQPALLGNRGRRLYPQNIDQRWVLQVLTSGQGRESLLKMYGGGGAL